MSNIQDLIKEFCPEGVGYKRIKEVYVRVKGTSITAGKMKEIASETGEIRIFAGGKTVIDAHESDVPNANIVRVPAVLVQSRGMVDFIYYDKPFTFKNEMWAYTCDDKVSVKYLYYVLKNNVEYFRTIASGMGSMPQISLPVTEDYKIPFPPIEVQREIVRIFDGFTMLISELNSELAARQKQYEFYLNSFFEELPSESRVPISSIGTLTRGKRFVHGDAVDEGVPCIHYGELYTYYGVYASTVRSHIREELRPKMRYAKKGDVIIVGAGENNTDIGVGVAWDGDEEVAVHDACYTLNHQQNSKYISYFLRTNSYHDQIKRFVSEGKICSISAEGIGRALIPIPSIEKQNEIVEKLDYFNALISDREEGLPAEINAREKQYEYYREKILKILMN